MFETINQKQSMYMILEYAHVFEKFSTICLFNFECFVSTMARACSGLMWQLYYLLSVGFGPTVHFIDINPNKAPLG